ncbi:hypothetical protein K7X08_023205 [Anisodus acutangulus]|uniref:Uncharacterized protein n=1 Tax=Anisodus acutangulus TaxID=402998 RepID=A0A9Q1QZ55_9SOLA|nr:hypothetical protein K7X08_023205 [Anisodus acutangulus]
MHNANPNPSHANSNPSNEIKILETGNVVGNVDDIYKWKTQEGKTNKKNDVPLAATGIDGGAPLVEAPPGVGAPKPVDITVTLNQECVEVSSTTYATGTAEKARRLWSEDMEEDGEEGEIPSGNIGDQEPSDDSITTSQQMKEMFEETADFVDEVSP